MTATMTTGPTDSSLCCATRRAKALDTNVPEDDINPTDSSLCTVSRCVSGKVLSKAAEEDDDNDDNEAL